MAATLPTNALYDKFAITTPQQREIISTFNNVLLTEDTLGNISYVPDTGLLSVKSTGGLSQVLIGDTAIASGPGFTVGADFGFQIEILLPVGKLPVDFSSLGTDKLFIGIENDLPSGDLVAGFFISEVGIAVANSASAINTVLPDTAALVAQFRKSSGEPLVLRIAFREDDSFAPIQHIMSVAIGQDTRRVFTFEQGSLPFVYAGSDDRMNIQAIGTVETEVLVGFMGLSSQINTYAITTQPNPGPDEVVELGDVARLDGDKSLAPEQIVVSGNDLRNAQVEPSINAVGVAITRTGDTAAGPGFTDTFTITAPVAEEDAIPNTKVGDFITINGVSHIIATLAFPTITVEEPQIPLGLTAATWQVFSRDIVEAPTTGLTGVIVSDVLRVNNDDNRGQYAVTEVLSLAAPFRLKLASPLPVAATDMIFDIGPSLRPPTELSWVFLGGPADSQLQDFVDMHRDGNVLRFIPDVIGTYRFELTVDSAFGDFVPSFIDVIVEVLPTKISPGELPDTSFMWAIISDFYSLPADREHIQTTWSGDIQGMADELLRLYQYDYNKSLKDIQRTVQRKFQRIDALQEITRPVLSSTGPFVSTLKLSGSGGSTFPNNIFEVLTATFQDDGVNIGDIMRLNGQTFAVSEVLSNVRLRIVGRDFTEGLTSLAWEIQEPLSVTAEEDLEDLNINLIDTVRFVLTGPTGDVFRAEEEILFVTGRTALIDPNAPEITQVLADKAISFDQLQAFEIEGLRRQTVFPVDKLILRIPLLEEIVPTPSDVYLSNLNYLVEPGKVTVIPDFDGRTPFAVRKTEGLAGTTLINNVFEDAAATFITSSVVKGDTLHIGADTFKISEVISETQVRTSEVLIVGQLNLGWRISHLAPDRLWAEFVNIDNAPTIQANFGHLVNLTADEASAVEFDYLSAVRGLFKSFFSGPTVESIRVGLELLNGLPVSEAAGELIEITAPVNARIGRIRIRDIADPAIIRVYFFPQELGLADIEDPDTSDIRPLRVGDLVAQFQSLSKGVDVEDYINSPKWWVPFANQGLLSELEKFATFKATISSKIFDVDNIDFIISFLESIKPTYVKLALIVEANLFADTIEVNDANSGSIVRAMRSGVFVPVSDLDDMIDGAGSAIKRLDFDTNFPVSVSPHIELAEVSKFENLDGSALPPLARLSDIRDPAHAWLRSTSTRFGIGSVQPDNATFIADPGSFTAPTDIGKSITINGLNRTIVAVLSDTTIQVTPSIVAFLNVPWTITDSTGTILFPVSGDGELEDITANFQNGAGLPLVDDGDFLEILHPDINSGVPTLVHVLRTVSNTKIEFSNFTTLFDKDSAAFPPGTHVEASWTVYRGLRYMPKPAINDVSLGDNNVLNESLVPFERVGTTIITPDANPADDSGDTIVAAPALSNGVRFLESIFSTIFAGVGTSFRIAFNDDSLISMSALQPVDGSAATPLGHPVIRKIVLWDILDVGDPAENVDGLLESAREIRIYRPTDDTLLSWTLHEIFNTASSRQVTRFDRRTEIILTAALPADIKGLKIYVPSGLSVIKGVDVLNIAEVEIYLSAEFLSLPKNHRADLVDDSRPEDVLGFQRKLASSTSMSGTGDVAAGGFIFTDTSFGGVAFSPYDLGKSIVIAGETRTIVKITASGANIDTIEVDTALTVHPNPGVAWSISAGASDLVDGNIK